MAGQIPQPFIDDLLSRIDIVDVINQRVSLKKSGSNYTACCPFHNEKTPSFSVSQTKQFYHCFGCSENGNAIGFLMAYDNMHFVDAIETLAESIGLDVPRDEKAKRLHNDSRPLYALLDEVSKHYQAALKDDENAIEYLKKRGLSGEIAKQYAIGFAPDGWDGLNKAFPKNEADLIKTGMLIKNDKGRTYQRFRNRIMFPIRDRRGRVIAFGGRVLDNEEPKYLNSPETPLFHKGSELYGLYEARKSAQELGTVVVVEGYMDVVALAQHGIENAVATLGTAANQQHSDILFKLVPNIVFCFDGDKAGRSAAWRALQATLPCLTDGHDAHFLFLPDGEDPDSVVTQGGAAGFNDLLTSRQSIIDFLFAHLSINLDLTSIGGKATLADKAKPLLETIPKGVYKQLATRKLEKLIGLSLGSERAGASRPTAKKQNNAPNNLQNLTAMSRAVLIALQHPAVIHEVNIEQFKIDTSVRGAEVLQAIISYCQQTPQITTARLLERFRESANFAYLNSLAIKPYWPDNRELDAETATIEFAHCLEQLHQRTLKTHAQQVDASARKGLLSVPKKT